MLPPGLMVSCPRELRCSVDCSKAGDTSSSGVALGATTCVSRESGCDCSGAGHCGNVVVKMTCKGGAVAAKVDKDCTVTG